MPKKILVFAGGGFFGNALIVAGITAMFFRYPEATGVYFGYRQPVVAAESKVLAAETSRNQFVNGNILATVLKPFSLESLFVVNATSPQTYAKAVPSVLGSRGLTGANGTNGKNGLSGPTGLIGPIGPQGPKGSTGSTGANGIDGTSGTNTGDQIITLTGDISGSGTSGITTIIGSGKVTTANLASANISQFTNNSGYITGLSWGGITGTLSNQTDLQAALNLKANTSDLTITLTGDITGSGTGSFATTIGTGKVTNANLVNSALTITPGTGLTGGGSVSLGGATTLGLASSNISQFTNNSNYLTTNQTITLSGDLSGSGTTAITGTIGSGAVTLGKLANLAANSIIGNNTSSATTPIALTAAQVKSLLSIANIDVSGLGTLSTQNASGIAITGGTAVGFTGFGIRSSGTGAFDLTINNTENLTAGRILTITTGNAARTLTLTGDANITGTNTGDN